MYFFNLNDIPQFFKVLKIINLVVINILGIFYINQIFYLIASIFVKKKTFREAIKNHTFGFLIAARNEEEVIGNLIDSIKLQNYPLEKLKIFVVADNCTDGTYKISKEHGAIVYERFNNKNVGKSYALDFLLRKINQDNLDKDIEAFFVFDADNLLDKNYCKEMNKCYDSGFKIATSFRKSKNFSDSLVSGASSLMYLRECREVHRVRLALNSSTYVSGTGFYIDYDIIKSNFGWIHHTLIEDIEFSTDQAIKQVQVGFCEDACFYDEQPITLISSLKQRLRWCKGTHQVFIKYVKTILSSIFKKFTFIKWSMLAHISPLPVITLIWTVLYFLISLIASIIFDLSFLEYLRFALGDVLGNFFIPYLLALINAIILIIQVWKNLNASVKSKILSALYFPIFMFYYLPLSFIAIFQKPSWNQTVHNCKRSIDDM